MADIHSFRRSNDIEIGAPSSEVYHYVCNPNSWPEWIKASHHLRSPDRALEKGETFEEEWHTKTGPAILKWTVMKSDIANQWIAETIAEFLGPIIVTYDFEDTAAGCKFSRTVYNPVRPKPASEKMIKAFDEEAAECLTNIKRNVEQKSGRAARI